MWEKIKVKSYNSFWKKSERYSVQGLNKEGLIISRSAEFAIVVEKQVIRNLLVEHLIKLQSKGKVKNLENQMNISALDYMTFFTYNDREILLLPPMMGAPVIECVVQDSYSMGVDCIVRLGTTGALTRKLPMYSFIGTTGAIRHDGTSDNYLPLGFPAIPNKTLLDEIVKRFNIAGIELHEGISYTTSTRFKEDVKYLLDLNKKFNVLNIEMESACLFSVATALGMKSASLSMITDCLADEEELKSVEGTLVGIPKYQEYIDKGLPSLQKAFDLLLDVFSSMSYKNPRFNDLTRRIAQARKTQKVKSNK